MKQEASGFLPSSTMKYEKQTHVRDYEEHEHILLDYDKLQYYPGLRHASNIF